MNVSVSVRRIALVLVLTTLVLVGPARSLLAANDVPFSATGSAVFVDKDGKYNVFALEGTAKHFGSFTGVGLAWFRGSYYQITWTLENDRGETLELFIISPENVGTYQITGGTGRFASATGSGTIEFGESGFILDGGISY